MRFLVSICLFFCPGILFSKESNKIIHLEHSWEYQSEGEKYWNKCSELKDVISLHLEKEKIASPFSIFQLKKYREFANRKWIFRKTFVLDSLQLVNRSITLFIDKIDLFATILINGKEAGTNTNYFLPFEKEISNLVKKGENELRIIIHPISEIIDDLEKDKFRYPADNDPNSVYLRKIQSEFGWDIFPALFFPGIRGEVKLELSQDFRIINTNAAYEFISDESATLYLSVEIDSRKETDFEVNWKSTNSDVNTTQSFHSGGKGKEWFTVKVSLKNPKKWWPAGYGEQFLYEFVVTASTEKYESKKDFSVGLRTIDLQRKKDKAGGESFTFRVNGEPIFAKGANYVPVNYQLKSVLKIGGCCEGNHYKQLFDRMQDLNFNMIRVWGGGDYPTEEFYDLADRYGILVWQDFMFAGSMYPAPNQMSDVEEEFAYHVQRIRKHPSLALWCGNNEIEIAWKNWGWQKKFGYSQMDSTVLMMNYERLFTFLIPSVLKRYDSLTPYLSSSPISNWGKQEDFKTGNNHYWGVWHGEKLFESFEQGTGRFMTEYGFPSIPSMESLLLSFTKNDFNFKSDSVRNHLMRSYKEFRLIEWYMNQYYFIPQNTEDYIFLSQILQNDALVSAIETHRRRMRFCMGSLLWQMNDAWPGITWSIVDYTNQPKASYFGVKRSFEKLVITSRIQNNILDIYSVSDAKEDFIANLNIRIIDFNGKQIYHHKEKATIGKRNSNIIKSIPVDSLFPKPDTNFIVMHFWFSNEKNEIIAENFKYFAYSKNLSLVKPKISVQVEKNGIVNITSNTLVRYFRLGYKKRYDWWTNNYFDLLPGKKYSFVPDSSRIDLKEYSSISKKTIEMKYLNGMK